MKHSYFWPGLLMGLVLAIFLGLAIWQKSEIYVALCGAIVTAGAIIWGHHITTLREIYSRHFVLKADTYQLFVNFLFKNIKAQKQKSTDNTIPPDSASVNEMLDFKQKLMIWGSPEVIKAMEEMENQSSGNEEKIKKAENLLHAMRKDLGHDDTQLDEFGLTKIILTPDARKELE